MENRQVSVAETATYKFKIYAKGHGVITTYYVVLASKNDDDVKEAGATKVKLQAIPNDLATQNVVMGGQISLNQYLTVLSKVGV
ncbi:MAG: hypothetical protein HRU20_02695 [Pseudomonadales bacterium]|nr:hypothetical protein [Pseudomonadales bacterium]